MRCSRNALSLLLKDTFLLATAFFLGDGLAFFFILEIPVFPKRELVAAFPEWDAKSFSQNLSCGTSSHIERRYRRLPRRCRRHHQAESGGHRWSDAVFVRHEFQRDGFSSG